MHYPLGTTIPLGGTPFKVVKDTRLAGGVVLQAGDVFARLGDRELTLAEEVHTKSLKQRGFPVPIVLGHGTLPDGSYYFTESSVGSSTFHERFKQDYQALGSVQDATYSKYYSLMQSYAAVQFQPSNRVTISARDFVETLIPNEQVLDNYSYFGHNTEDYLQSRQQAIHNLEDAAMGILQFDLNPYNVLEHGIIDFELVGYGPLGYDIMMSARWGGTWFTAYPSRYPLAYRLSEAQIIASDRLLDDIATQHNVAPPSIYLQEFLFLKTAWALSEFDTPSPDWPADKLAFRHFRANLLRAATDAFLAGKPIPYQAFSTIPSGQFKVSKR